MKLGELLNSLLGKAGVKADDENLKKLLSNAEAMQVEVPDELSKPLEQNLLTVESAIANANVRGPLFAEFNGSIDNVLDRFPEEWGFDDIAKGEIKSIEKNTKEKLKKIGSKTTDLLKELRDKASKPPKGPDAEQHQKEVGALKSEIERLNREAENIKAQYQAQVNTLQENNLNDKKTFAFRTLLAGKPLPKNNLPASVNILTAENLIKQEMAKNGLAFHLDEFGNLILKQRKDGTDMDFFVNNKKVDAPDFIDGVLAQNKFIQINDPGKPPINGGGGTPPATPPGTPVNSAIAQESAMKLESLLGAQV